MKKRFVASITHLHKPGVLICSARRDQIAGTPGEQDASECELKAQFSPLAGKAIEREFHRQETHHAFKSIMSGLRVSIREFEC